MESSRSSKFFVISFRSVIRGSYADELGVVISFLTFISFSFLFLLLRLIRGMSGSVEGQLFDAAQYGRA